VLSKVETSNILIELLKPEICKLFLQLHYFILEEQRLSMRKLALAETTVARDPFDSWSSELPVGFAGILLTIKW
jgi:hypothetical protein